MPSCAGGDYGAAVFSRPRSILLAASTLLLLACGADAPAPEVPAPPVASAPPPQGGPEIPGHSIDTNAMDRTVKAGDDFFMFANGGWYARAVIAPDRKYTGVSLKVSELVETQTRALLDEAAKANAPKGSTTQQIGDYYATYLDEAAIEAQGIKPLAPVLARIAKIKDARALAEYLGSSIRADVDPLNNTSFHTDHVLGVWVEQDLNDVNRSAAYLLQGGIGMPDRVYYIDEKRDSARKGYVKHLAAILKLAGIADPDKKAARIFELEKKIAASHSDRADSEDVTKGNNPWKKAEFATKAPGLDWNVFFAAAGLDKQAGFIVWHPKAMTGLAALVKSEPLDVWRDYLTARAIDHMSSFLPKAFVDEAFAFYAKELQGVAQQAPRWRRAIDETTDALGDALGKAYVDRHFPPETKRAADEMVKNLVAAMGRRIDALAWMAPATKAKAKEKLATLKVGVGYPDHFRDDSGLDIVKGDAFGNFERAELFEYKRNLGKLTKPVDRGEWCMYPHVVNAVNLPVRNALNFPAAILSPPFFDAKSTPAANYGSIGSVIGHEISHSFDDQGAKFDAKGQFVNWWTPEDLAHFEASGAALAAQFSTYKPFPDMAIDGKLTLSENIADLAGIAVSYDAWKTSLNGAPAPTQDGLSGDQQFFLAFAQGWQEKERDETMRQHLSTDGHAPPRYRTQTVRNLDAWYPAFDVKPEDKLFLPANTRVRVW